MSVDVIPNNTFARSHDGEMFEVTGGGRFTQDVFDDMLAWLKTKKVSDVTIQSGEPVWAQIGKTQCRMTRRAIDHPEVATFLRGAIGDHGPGMVNGGRSLDFAYDIKRPVGRLRFRVNATCGLFMGTRGMSMTLRSLPSVPLTMAELGGIEPEILENFRSPQGLNLFTGPTNSGKSTLMSSLMRWHCEKPTVSEKVIEHSMPVEYVYDDLEFPASFFHQSSPGDHLVPSDVDMESGFGMWSYAVFNSLRRAATIIIIGETRDPATIEGVITTSLTGHLVMTTMHTSSVPEIISRATGVFPSSQQSRIAIDMLEGLNLMVTQLLLPQVGGGRVACREFMVMDRKTRAALIPHNHEMWPRMMREMLSKRNCIGRSMADSAEGLLKEGRIDRDVFEWIANRTSAKSKVERTALGMDLSMEDFEGDGDL